MGIFLDKIVKPLFRSQKGNWVSRINELTDNQLKIAYSGQTKQEKEGDRMAFVNALDGLVDYIDNYEVLMESVSEFYVKFDIKSAKPLHNKALKNPEKLSEKEKLLFFDHSFLFTQNINRQHERIPRELLMLGPAPLLASQGLLTSALGIICFPETRKKGFELWKYLYVCFAFCEKFNYTKHLPKEVVKLLEKEVFIF